MVTTLSCEIKIETRFKSYQFKSQAPSRESTVVPNNQSKTFGQRKIHKGIQSVNYLDGNVEME